MWVNRPADRNGSSEKSEARPLRTCADTTVTTIGPVPVRPRLAHADERSALVKFGQGPLDAGGHRGREEVPVQRSAEASLQALRAKST